MGGRASLWLSVLTGLAGCGRIGFDARGDATGDGASSDTPLGAWSTPMPVPGASAPGADEQDCAMTSDLLELYFNLTTVEDTISVMTRAAIGDAWSAPLPASFDSAPDEDANPRLAPDDRTLYFGSLRSGSQGFQDVMITQRTSVAAAWSAPTFVTYAGVNTVDFDKWFSVCSDGHYVMVRTLLSQSLGERLFQGQIGGAAPTEISELDIAPAGEVTSAFLTSDCLTLYFASDPSGQRDLYVTSRATVTSTWEVPQVIADFSDPVALDEDPWISQDGRTFCFASDRANPGTGVRDLYISTR